MMDINHRKVKDHTIIELFGDIDYVSIGELKDLVFKFINEKIPSIILDLKNVEYMDSSGIGLVVTANKVMRNYNGKLGLLNVREDILVLLKLSTVDRILKIYKSEDELE